MVLFLPQVGDQSHGSAVRSTERVWIMTPLCTRKASQQFHSGMVISVKKKYICHIQPLPSTPMAELWRLWYWTFISCATNNFWKVSDRGQFSAALLHPGHFQGPSHTLLVFLLKLVSCPVKGLAFFHCSSISTDSEENLCWERRDWLSFYNRANCLRLPHSVKCLLCCSQLIRKQKVGQRGLTAEQRCHASVHLKPRLQWETSPFQAFPSSSKGQVPGSKFQSAIPPVWIHNLE